MAQPAPEPLPIRIYGDPCLRHVCREVRPDEDVSGLVSAMVEALDRAGGVGLAAPQVGDPRRVILCRDPAAAGAAPTVMINPEIVATDGPPVRIEEGCLSFPDLFVHVRRPRGVRVRYHDLAGRVCDLAVGGLVARIILHEVDHLDGVLFVDRLPAWRRWLLRRRLRGYVRQAGKAAA